MANKLTFDAIVVGGGLAGTSTAITMAKAGLQTILIERGRFVGAKNFFRGVLYTHALDEVLTDWQSRAPALERPVTDTGYWLLSPDSVLRFTQKSERFKKAPAESYTALRANFDPWFAQQAVDLGVLVITKTTVTGFLRDERGRVIGVTTDRPDGDVYAPVVIIGEGVNNLLTQQLGLAKSDLPPRYVALSVKEYLGSREKEVEARHSQRKTNSSLFGLSWVAVPSGFFLSTYTYQR